MYQDLVGIHAFVDIFHLLVSVFLLAYLFSHSNRYTRISSKTSICTYIIAWILLVKFMCRLAFLICYVMFSFPTNIVTTLRKVLRTFHPCYIYFTFLEYICIFLSRRNGLFLISPFTLVRVTKFVSQRFSYLFPLRVLMEVLFQPPIPNVYFSEKYIMHVLARLVQLVTKNVSDTLIFPFI